MTVLYRGKNIYATAMPSAPPQIFDRKTYALRRARANRLDGDCFLATEAATRLAERIGAVNRRFVNALDLSSRKTSFAVLNPLADNWRRTSLSCININDADLAADEEAVPFKEAQFDLITSVLSLHAVNDLPGVLVQIRRILKPDGLFMAALFGDATLHELRTAFALAESETRGGTSPRVAPFADVRDLGGLLQRAGFTLPVADSERTIVRYRDLNRLSTDLRELGETNALRERARGLLGRSTFAALLDAYSEHHRDADGKLRATFDIVYLTGWSVHESQQKPLKPGSAAFELAEVLSIKNKT